MQESLKLAAEVEQSDVKVNIFVEDETAKENDEITKNNVEQSEEKHAATSNYIGSKDGYNNSGDDKDVEKGLRDEKKEIRGMRMGQQTTWVQFNTAYSDYGGYEGHGPPLDYDPQSRNYFVKFVLIIVLIMLVITAAFTAFVLATPEIKDVLLRFHFTCLMISMAIILPLNCTMFCSECARRPPCNFICLVFAVIGMSILVATITSRYRTNIVLYAVIATVVVVAVCVILACTSFDFTSWYLYVVGIMVAFAVIATIVSVTMLVMNVRYKPVQLAILCVATLLNVVILIMELQMILGGRNIEIGESDYALAAYMLYTSIVDIFLKIVQILGLFDD